MRPIRHIRCICEQCFLGSLVMSASLIPKFKTLRMMAETGFHRLIPLTQETLERSFPMTKSRKQSISVAEASREGRLKLKTTNFSQRVTFLVLLLFFAVALTTALVLAGEKNSGGARKKAQHVVPRDSICVQLKAESSEWNIA